MVPGAVEQHDVAQMQVAMAFAHHAGLVTLARDEICDERLRGRPAQTADEPRAPDRNDDRLDVRDLLQDFKTERALARDHVRVIKGVDEGRAGAPYPLHRGVVCRTEILP